MGWGAGGSMRTGPPDLWMVSLARTEGSEWGEEAEAAASVSRKRRSYCRSALSPLALK